MTNILLNLLFIHIIITIFCIISIKCAEIKMTRLMQDERFICLIEPIIESTIKNYNPSKILIVLIPIINIVFTIVYVIFSLAKEENIIKFLEFYMNRLENNNKNEKDDNNENF